MKILVQIAFLALGASSVAAAQEVISNAQASKLIAAYNCQACHSLGKSSLPGPSWHAIAKKYASDSNAVGDLEASVVNGSSGTWGDNAMPPINNPNNDLDALLNWILQTTTMRCFNGYCD
jgi:cytochrome c